MNESSSATMDRHTLSARLAEALTERQMSAAGLARATDIPDSTVRQWLDTGNPTVTGLQAMANALDLDLLHLVREPLRARLA